MRLDWQEAPLAKHYDRAAVTRCIRVADEIGGVGLLIDATNDRAAQWYVGYGALPLLDAPLSLVLTFAVAADALKRGDIGK